MALQSESSWPDSVAICATNDVLVPSKMGKNPGFAGATGKNLASPARYNRAKIGAILGLRDQSSCVCLAPGVPISSGILAFAALPLGSAGSVCALNQPPFLKAE
jgi:hypothetical protein